MLTITVKSREVFDEKTSTFHTIKGETLKLEHSLISISKWESKWKKPYLTTQEKTDEEAIDYIRCMTLTKPQNDIVYSVLTKDNLRDIRDYIQSPMSATTFPEGSEGSGGGVIQSYTSEEIYALMVIYNIPFSCQKWHINRLLTLIRVCDIKQSPPKKLSQSEILRRNHDLNEQRRAQMNTKG